MCPTVHHDRDCTHHHEGRGLMGLMRMRSISGELSSSISLMSIKSTALPVCSTSQPLCHRVSACKIKISQYVLVILSNSPTVFRICSISWSVYELVCLPVSMSMGVSVYGCVCLWVFFSMGVFFYGSVCLWVFVCIWVCVFICRYIYL